MKLKIVTLDDSVLNAETNAPKIHFYGLNICIFAYFADYDIYHHID